MPPTTEKSPAEPAVSPLDKLIAEKVAAGLPKADAIECAKRQLEHDKALAESGKKS
jgi:hypothetical protein